jgi:hypothetical protein
VLPFLFRRLTTVDLRRVALGCALVGIAAIGIYPPWNYALHLEGRFATTWPAPRALIFGPPAPPSASCGVVLAGGRLALEWLVVAALTAAGYLLLPRRRAMAAYDQAQEDAIRKQLIDSHLRNVVRRWRQMATQGGDKEVWAEVADLVEEDLGLAQDPNGTDHG